MNNASPYSLENVNIDKIQYIAIAGSLVLLMFILNLIRTKRIKEEYSLLWLVFGMVFMVFSVWREGLDIVSGFLGIAYPPAAIFIVLFIAFFMILIQYSIIISKQANNNKNITQEHGLLKFEVEQLKKRLEDSESKSA